MTMREITITVRDDAPSSDGRYRATIDASPGHHGIGHTPHDAALRAVMAMWRHEERAPCQE